MKEKTWQKYAPSQIILNAIFAALVGVLIPLIILDHVNNYCKLIDLGLLVWSFVLFALSAEQTVNSLDENDVQKYVYYMLWYNLGVILLGAAFAIEIYAHFASAITRHINVPLPLLWLSLIFLTILLLWRWIYDFFWLICIGRDKFLVYLDELEDRAEPRPEPSCLMRVFYKRKKLHVIPLPHQGVYTRLKCSPIHGIGVFAIRNIPKGALVFAPDDDKTVSVRREDVETFPPELRSFYHDFCVLKGGSYICPVNFNKLTPGWYPNNSDEPNITPDAQLRFRAIRDVAAGEELTSRYSDYSENDT